MAAQKGDRGLGHNRRCSADAIVLGWRQSVRLWSLSSEQLDWSDLRGGDFHIHAAEGREWALSSPETIAAKADPARTDTLSHVMLSTFGMEKMQVMRPATKGGSRNVSFRDIANFTFIEEERIIAKKTPVYPSMQRDAVTPELSMLSLLISGRDFSGMIKLPDMKVEKATWKGKNELYEQLIVELKKEVGDNPPSQKDITDRVAAADVRIVEVTTKIEESNKIIADLMKTRKTAWEGAHQARSRLAVVEQLKDRFEQLHKHYKSDMQRLEFISEGDFFLAQLGKPHCPFCGEPLEEHSATQLQEEAAKGSIQEAATEEAKKIAANVRDLEKTLAALRGEEGQLGTQVTKRQEEINNAEKTIRQELEPRIGADKKELAELAETRGRLLSMQGAIERLAMLTARHQALGKEPKKAKGTSAAATAKPDAASLRLLSNEIAAILKDWRYMKTGVAEFDKEMDLVVAGEPRTNQGKGIRAVLHAAFTVGLMSHCLKQMLRHSGVVMLDSPLTSYKEKDKYEVEEDIQIGFFDSLLKLPGDQQVIVFENKEPPAAVLPRLRHTHFSGTPGVNRAGFIPPNPPPPGDTKGHTSGAGSGDGRVAGAGVEGGQGGGPG